MSSSFAFNTLVQPSSTVQPSGLPDGFDAGIALLLATCCSLTYQQYGQGDVNVTPLLDQLPFQSSWSYRQIGSLTGSEAIGFGAALAGPGAFVTVPFGFLLSVTDSSSEAPVFNVLALRGTQTYAEWLNDAESVPALFQLDQKDDPAFVHAGFYGQYTIGTDGTPPSSGTSRASGSLAAQVQSLLEELGQSVPLPLYVTGHSLGAALAVFAALDVAVNFAASVSEVTLYHFAPPRVAAGLTLESIDLGDPSQFVKNFSSHVPNAFAVVNAADIVPTLPFTSFTFGPAALSFSQVVSSPVVYCGQLGDISLNHSLADNYLQYVTLLQEGFS
jgi:triacylglycerol lipase